MEKGKYINDERGTDEFLEEILNKYPDTKNMLKGFTYYKNTIGKFPTTKGALPHILTGVANDNSVPFVEYKEKAFLESPIYQEAIKKDFLVDVYAKAVFAPTESTIDAVGVVKNVSFVKPELKDVVNYFIDTYNSSVFSYLPHFLKKHFI